MYIIFVYMRPFTSSRSNMEIDLNCYDEITNKLASVDGRGRVLVTGDLNARTGTREDCFIYNSNNDITPMISNDVNNNENVFVDEDFLGTNITKGRKNKDSNVNDYGIKLLNLCYSANLLILNGRAYEDAGGAHTFCNSKGMSTIDYVLCDRHVLNYVTMFKVHDFNMFSDHAVVAFNIKSKLCTNTLYGDGQPGKCVYVKWKDNKKDEYISNLSSNDTKYYINMLMNILEENVDKQIVEDVLAAFTGVLTESGQGHTFEGPNNQGVDMGRNRKDRKGHEWYDKECRVQRKVFEEYIRKFKNESSDENRHLLCSARSRYRQICRLKRKEHNLNAAKRLADLAKRRPNCFWKEVRAGRKREKVGDCDFFNHFKKLAEEVSEIDEEGTREVNACNELISDNDIVIEELDAPIDWNELNAGINELKNNKAAGVDNIINEYLIHAPTHVKKFILVLFNNIMDLQFYPSFWSYGVITPVKKKGDGNDVNNYRGISLLSCLGKLFTRILSNRLNSWAEVENKLNEEQFGFRKGRGTNDCLFVLHGLIEILLSQGKKLFCCFVDYEKAYDRINRAVMFTKLFKLGLSRKMMNILRSMYSGMKLSVKGNDDYFYSHNGLMQGEVCSPILFSLFISDLENSLQDDCIGVNVNDVLLKLLVFADDQALLSESRKGLQKGLNELEKYCGKWGLNVNTAKTQIMVFRKGGKLATDDKWTYRGQPIEIVSSFKYLGCKISTSGSFTEATSDLISSARRGLFSLKCFLSKNKEILPSTQIKLYESLITPILFYGSEVWGLRKCDPIERFYLMFLKNMLYVKNSTPSCFVYGELGLTPLAVRRKVSVIKYWLRIIDPTRKKPKYVLSIYNEMLKMTVSKPRAITWASLVKDLLCRCGLGVYWELQGVGNANVFLSLFKQRVHDMFLQGWREDVTNTSSLRLFKHIKTEFKFEEYLNLDNKSYRIAITKIRLSSHLFLIERGRWGKNRIDSTLRVCDICCITEDEFHCLLVCPRFVNEREGCLPDRLMHNPNIHGFLSFMKSSDKCILRKLGLLCNRILRQYGRELMAT